MVARFEDGTQATGDFLIGCDGLHSRTRQIVAPDSPKPAYTGQLSLGGFTHSHTLPSTPGVVNMVFGKRAFFGYLVKPSGEIYWFSNIAMASEPARGELADMPSREWRERLLALHAEDPHPVSEMIRSTQHDIGAYPIYDLLAIPRWHKGPLVLIGDAAHATSPSAGQGASLALEDSIVLAKCLRDIDNVEHAFSTYTALRKERVEKLVKMARRTGGTKIAGNPVTRWLRDLMMPFFLERFANPKSQSWIYSYVVDWNEPAKAAAA